ncbi:UBX domain-containing protein [Rhynchospora pubera]|uniref:UBX domain-containing protein n=1 Tax=Rhynchospora pubera TaxID=906938 RepID=A0AAV8BNJ5_9POAL|nr:UBX domain-containing protein [Rhynchospora pubera]KAJ4806099.1 UBX domain-containing protein [Rhynchospora pubera]
MEGMVSSDEKDGLISTFLEIAVGQTIDTASHFLEATNWKLEEALQLFYLGNEGGVTASPSLPPVVAGPPVSANASAATPSDSPAVANLGEDEVRAPLPAIRDTLYGDLPYASFERHQMMAFRDFEQESRQQASAVWNSGENSDQNTASTANSSPVNLASLYQPPFALMYNGPFDKAKLDATLQEKWLLVNIQSTEEFSSHMLNRDTWTNDTLSQTIKSNFLFWQVYNTTSEGRKVCTFYNLVTLPAILVIDPITGQKMRAWTGMVEPDRLLEDLLPYLDKGPKDIHAVLPLKRPREISHDAVPITPGNILEEDDEDVRLAIAASLEDAKGFDTGGPHSSVFSESKDARTNEEDTTGASSSRIPEYPPLPEEPKVSRDLLCRVGIRLPDGRRLQRNFLKTDTIKLLWSFCCTELESGQTRPFHFAQSIPGAPAKNLEFEKDQTFEDAGLANSMVNLLLD